MADLGRPQCPCLGMVPLKCTQGMGNQKSFLLSHVKAPAGSRFHTESWLEERNLALVSTSIILLSASPANSSLRHGFQRKLNILFSTIYSPSELSLCIVNAHCSEIDLSPSPDDYLEFSMSETDRFLFRPNMTMWGVVIHASNSSLGKNGAGKW